MCICLYTNKIQYAGVVYVHTTLIVGGVAKKNNMQKGDSYVTEITYRGWMNRNKKPPNKAKMYVIIIFLRRLIEICVLLKFYVA